MRVITESIWAADGYGSFSPRKLHIPKPSDIHSRERFGQEVIIVDDAHVIIDNRDFGRIIPVTAGLKLGDIAVFLYFDEQKVIDHSIVLDPMDELEDDTDTDDRAHGFLVSKIEPDGSGILVSADMLEADPDVSLGDDMLQKLMFMQDTDHTIFEEFSLLKLEKIVKHRRSVLEQTQQPNE